MIQSFGPPRQNLPGGLSLAPVIIEIVAVDMNLGGGMVSIQARVVDRDNPYNVIDLAFHDSGSGFIFSPYGSNPEQVLRAALKRLVCHEIDEAIRVNGVRVFDPHVYGDR